MARRLNYFVLSVIVALNLLACGGGSSGTSSPVVVPAEVESVPIHIINRTFIFNLESSVEQHNFLPAANAYLSQEFRSHGLSYVQSDIYRQWGYQRNYQITSIENNVAIVLIELPTEGSQYQLRLTFETETTGRWQLGDEQAVAGRFTSENLPNFEQYHYEGEVFRSQSYASTITDTSYHYHVYLPEGYSSDKSMPIVYATDGQWNFWTMAHAIDKSQQQMILVAITEGPSGRRAHDYALTGSANYLRFLELEFLPHIESTYAVNPKKRVLTGASWGGLLVRHSLANEVATPLFSSLISMDGSYFHENDQYLALEQSSGLASASLNHDILITGATVNGNKAYVKQYHEQLLSYDVNGLAVSMAMFDVLHNDIVLPSFRYWLTHHSF